jgi:biopolymer transport protein ExbB
MTTWQRAFSGAILVLAVLPLAIAARAQQGPAPVPLVAPTSNPAPVVTPQAAPAAAQAPAPQAPTAQTVGAPAPAANASGAQSSGNPPVAVEAPAAAQRPAEAETSARTTPGVGPLQELSPWSMFLSADLLVKAVIIGLFFASLVTWTILLAKTVQLSRARREINAALAQIADSRSLHQAQVALGATDNVLGALLTAATEEIAMSHERGGEAGIKERTASRFSEVVRVEARTARYGMSIIATIGATAPFVGLFGTVWGIMNSFIGISKAQTTNLAVVAPGIAEALLATAVGLAAAIPAVIIYNHFARATKAYLELVGRGSGAVGRLLSRDIDHYNGRTIARAAE